MKVCPICKQNYSDETLNFCLEDGAVLVGDPEAAENRLFFNSAQPKFENQVILPTQIPAAAPPQTPSIAVLLFVNLTGGTENDYFCSGLAEEILNALAKIEKLKVAARTSSFSFGGKDFNIQEIGRILKVQTVLEGSVKKSGNRLRIHVQLVNTEDGYQLWTERFDCEVKDIFEVQDEITSSVVGALKLKLLGEEKKAVFKRYTENTEVYQLYFKGRFELGKYTPEGWSKAVEIFKEAIRLEPQYTPAYVSLALCQMMLWYYGFLPLNETAPDWRTTARKVLEIDDSVAEARFMMAADYFLYEWKWNEAEREFREAVKLNPNNADVRWAYGMLLALIGRPEDAVLEAKKSLERDPLSLFVNMQAGWINWLAGKFEESLKIARRMIEQKPDFHGSYWLIGAVESARGNYDRAIEAHSQAMALNRSQAVLSHLGTAYAATGKEDAALVVLNKLLEMRKKQFIPAINIARIYSGLGDSDKTFEWLEKSFSERNGELPFLKLEAELDKSWGGILKQDPRFEKLLSRLNLYS